MFLLLVVGAVPLWLSSYANQFWQFLLLGLALGVVGTSFAVGTPYVARFFPKERRGFAMGVFGAGTTGAAINMFIAPILIAQYGWQVVSRFYAVALLITALIFWLLSAPDTNAPGKRGAYCASNWRYSRTCASGSTASITRSFLAASPRCPFGCRNTL
jgi:MFS transporter, NNP family, nitrate/nitrite transporter